MKKNRFRLAIAGVALVVLSACTALGIPKPQGFEEKLAAGYTAVSTARAGTLELLREHEITPQAAQKGQNKADQLRGALDLAGHVHDTDPGEAASTLQRAISAITEVQKCVDLQKADFSGCIDRVELQEEPK